MSTLKSKNYACRAALVLLAMLTLVGVAAAQLPMPPSTQFDITGLLQDAILGGPGTGAGAGAHQGGSLKVNGHTVIVPSETIVILPANALTWQELFTQAPAPYGPTKTGMALADTPVPLTEYEVHVVGNRVGDVYIAGLIDISQNALNSGAGFINYIDYATGEIRVGGTINIVNGLPTLDATNPGARVRINDPLGRFGRIMSPDSRFSVDDANPTIAAGTGFPMCIPRILTDPLLGGADDPLCPRTNRPFAIAPATGFAAIIQMNNPTTLPGVPPDATKQAPFEVGDYVNFAGTLVTDDPNHPTNGPYPGTVGTYISAHTIGNNIAIYTWPGINPAYVAIEVGLIGTGGLTVVGAGEAAIRTRFEGMTTDPSRSIHLYGVDLTPGTGATTDRDFGTIGVDPGPPAGAVKGRWRFRPPCLPFGSIPTKPDKECVMNAAGTFLPPPREVRAVIEGAWVPGQITTYANGIIAGQYHAPIGEYIFPENIPGSPIVENNFNTIDFLAKGGYSSSMGTVAGVLNPWPSNVVPTLACTPITANAGGPYTAPAGGTIPLNGTATGTGPLTFAWTATAGSISNPSIANPTYTAPASGAPNLTLTVTSTCGAGSSSTSNTSVTINAALAPTVAHVTPISAFSGASGSFVVSGSDPNVPAATPLTFTVTQAGAPALTVLTVTQLTATSAGVNYIAPVLPVGQVTSVVITLTITARNTLNLLSAPEFTTITVNPLPDAVAITLAEFRTSKQRLDMSASSTVVSPNVILKLQPYACQTVVGQVACPPSGTYNPDPAAGGVGNTFTNNGGGLYAITLVGAPAPACGATFATPCTATPLTVKSNLNGASPAHALDRIRQ